MIEHSIIDISDCHCDTLALFERADYFFSRLNSIGHVDLPRLIKGGVGLQFFAVCVSTQRHSGFFLKEALEYVHRYHRCLGENNNYLVSIERGSDLERARASGKIGCLLALEGAEPLEGSLELLEVFYRLGVRCLSLTWNRRNVYADGVGEESTGGGLSRIGRKTVRCMNELGIILDLAHISPRGYYDAVALAARPPLVTHANARTLCDHPRNLTDDQLKLLAQAKGVIGLSFNPPFINGCKNAPLERLIDHFVHIASVAGVEHTGIGSDFDGIPVSVDGVEDTAALGNLLDALRRRGFSSREVELIAGENVRRVVKQNLGDRTDASED